MLVLSTGLILTMLMVLTYRRAMDAHEVQSKVQLRTDYGEKEDAILRSIVAITPNRAIRAMQANSSTSSVSAELVGKKSSPKRLPWPTREPRSRAISKPPSISPISERNSGDSNSTLNLARICKVISPDATALDVFVSSGNNRSLGAGFPPPLSTGDTTNTLDKNYPIISNDKIYGSLAQSALDASGVGLPVATYPKFNRLKYPHINFGYAKPGEPFVAKRNWWAFSMDLAAQDAAVPLPDGQKTLVSQLARPARDFVLSIYEIPSQLAISASSFMSLGKYASGELAGTRSRSTAAFSPARRRWRERPRLRTRIKKRRLTPFRAAAA